MKSKDMFKQLFPGVIVGFILGFVINHAAGVNPDNNIPNIIGGVLACAVPTLLNGIIVLKGTAKHLDRTLSIGDAFKRNIKYIFVGSLIGFFFMVGMIKSGVELTQIPRMTNTITNAILGVVVSTLLGYLTIREYASDVKYTRKNNKKDEKPTKKTKK